MSQGTLIEVPAYNGNVDENQRYTTDEADAWLRSVAGVEAWDLDVAACAESHRAPRWYSREDDGLFQPWSGRVFLQPPWENAVLEAFVARAHIKATESAVTVIGALLPGGRTHKTWWREFIEPLRDRGDRRFRYTLDTYNPPKRFSYGHPGNVRGIGVPEPFFTTVGVVWRPCR